jgi:hypothetical protein
LDGSSQRITLPNNSSYSFRGQVVARNSSGDSAAWHISGAIKRNASAGTTALVGTPVISTHTDAGASTWALAITANTSGQLIITVTGQASTTIRWAAKVETVETTF